MRERLAELIPQAQGMWVSTFHSACVRILRRDGERVGLSKNFVIYDASEQTDADQGVSARPECLTGRQVQAINVLSLISKAKNELQSPEQYERRSSDFLEETVAAVYRLYQRKLLQNNAVDFDDSAVDVCGVAGKKS
jgi:DNA helicase-2/ATP-dependent DNA helicase PcrA